MSKILICDDESGLRAVLKRYAIFEETLAELERVKKVVKARDLSQENFKTLLELESQLHSTLNRFLYSFKKSAETLEVPDY